MNYEFEMTAGSWPSTDELQKHCLRMRKAHTIEWICMIVALSIIFIAILLIFLGLYYISLAAICVSIILQTIGFISMRCAISSKQERWLREFFYRANAVPNDKIQTALRVYGDNPDAILSAIECHECHGVGDCPLCEAL